MAQRDMVQVARSELLAAWMVLENLAVSLDQISGIFGLELLCYVKRTKWNSIRRRIGRVSFLIPKKRARFCASGLI